MKTKIYSLLVIAFAIIISSCTENKPTVLKVMTYNIRYDNPDDLQNNWKYRKDFAANMIHFYDVDIFGTQEVLKNQLDDLLDRLPEYTSLGVGRFDGKTEGEYSAIFYKTDKYEVLDDGHFWLSETPEVAGSMGWDAACERIVTWGIFKEIETGNRFAFVNTHFDHRGRKARKESALMLNKEVSRIVAEDLPVIVTGDFNAIETSEPIQTILEDGILLDTRKLAPIVYGPSWTSHSFGQIPFEKRNIIDYIFVTKDFSVEKYASISDRLDSTYLSDHNPVYVEAILNK
ncbi:endonuclease/exonuclease/phosphatase family protein [Sunxiuqinia sp. A32]|uniref:endonuclease/exonuclease/phosphatase family protein n=1 Tax=Sunxiuqinia sp. A32 TaxID=3461496 RepID=UPI00404593DC